MPVVFAAHTPEYITLFSREEIDSAIDTSSEKELFKDPLWDSLAHLDHLGYYDKYQVLKLVHALTHLPMRIEGKVSVCQVIDTIRQFSHLYSLAGADYKNHFFIHAARAAPPGSEYCLQFRLVDNDNHNLFKESIVFDASHEYVLMLNQYIEGMAQDFFPECPDDLQVAKRLFQQIHYVPGNDGEPGYMYGVKTEKQSILHLGNLDNLQKQMMSNHPPLAQAWVASQMKLVRHQTEVESAIGLLLQAYSHHTADEDSLYPDYEKHEFTVEGKKAKDLWEKLHQAPPPNTAGSRRINGAFKNLSIYIAEINKNLIELIKRDVFGHPHHMYPHALFGAPFSSLLRNDTGKLKFSALVEQQKTKESAKK
ncbi:MAG: hypothetical protein ACRC5A_09390 [Enterobacteriaceae bacterium]